MDYGAAAARYVDIYTEAIGWDNAAKLVRPVQPRELAAAVRREVVKDAHWHRQQCGAMRIG